MMRVIGIIPARYGSERFPAKVLGRIGSRTVLESAWLHAAKAETLDRLLVATDSGVIVKEAERIGAEAILTSRDCRSGSDRVAEAAKKIKGEIFVNVQADEPLIPAEAIDGPVAALLKDRTVYCATAAVKISKEREIANPNITKVVCDNAGFALYFSGSPVPYPRLYDSGKKTFLKGTVSFYKHIGIYAFRKNFLEKFSILPSGPLERLEKLEQLRILENGYKIKVVIIKKDSVSVDTPEDLEKLNG